MPILSPETEALVQEKTRQTGRTPDEVVREALKMAGHALAPYRPAGERLPRDELLERLRELSRRHTARPLLDDRTPEEIIGFDENGLPS